MAKILIVDDSTSNQEKITEILDELGHEYESAFNGKEGLEKVDSFEPDFIVTDSNMPVMCGLEFVASLRASRDQTLVVVQSTEIQHEVQRVYEGLDIYAFLNKPARDELKKILEEAVNESEMRLMHDYTFTC